MRTTYALALLLATMGLAGCLGTPAESGVGKVDATATTGGIRGVVVDLGVMPVPGARVAIANGPDATTDASGAFVFSGLAPGAYFLTVSKAGYTTVQQAADVEAGVAEPPIVKVLLERVIGKDPFVEHFRLDGFYECGFGAPFITDQCDFGVRTLYDYANGSVPGYPLPRNVQQGANTMYIDVPGSVQAVIQEAFWDDESVSAMKVSLDATPIDNLCDCSDSYMETTAPSPTYKRLDNATKVQGKTTAARGFLPFTDADPANPAGVAVTAVNFDFVLITSLFHHHVPAEAWTFETRAQHPLE